MIAAPSRIRFEPPEKVTPPLPLIDPAKDVEEASLIVSDLLPRLITADVLLPAKAPITAPLVVPLISSVELVPFIVKAGEAENCPVPVKARVALPPIRTPPPMVLLPVNVKVPALPKDKLSTPDVPWILPL
jgi:hypothetical protein